MSNESSDADRAADPGYAAVRDFLVYSASLPERAFRAAMDDDLETSGALAAVHSLVGQANRRQQAGALTPEDAASALAVLKLASEVLGLDLGAASADLTAEQQALVDERAAARANQDWAASDRLRDELKDLGVLVKDSKDGQEVTLL